MWGTQKGYYQTCPNFTDEERESVKVRSTKCQNQRWKSMFLTPGFWTTVSKPLSLITATSKLHLASTSYSATNWEEEEGTIQRTDNQEIYGNDININNALLNKTNSISWAHPNQVHPKIKNKKQKLFSYLCNKLKFQDLFLILLLYTSRIYTAKSVTLHVLNALQVSGRTLKTGSWAC